MQTQIQLPLSVQTQQLLEYAHQQRWGVRVVGVGEVPPEPVFKNGWWYEPLTESTTEIPKEGVKRAMALEQNFKIQGWIVAHEGPALLTAPKEEIDWEPVREAVQTAVTGVGAIVTAGAVTAVLTAMVAPVMIFAGLCERFHLVFVWGGAINCLGDIL